MPFSVWERNIGIFNTLKGKLRDKTRDEVCSRLCVIGLDARMVERGPLLEDVVGDGAGKSLGLIEIRDSPICWVNVLRHEYGGYAGPYGGGAGGVT